MPSLIAHETTHILQFTQLVYGGAASKAPWEMEGGATLAGQLVGNAVLGHGGSGQNLGATQFLEGYDWYRGWAKDLSFYFGRSSSGRVVDAPEQCTWLGNEDNGNDGPCLNPGRAIYGVPAILLRFVLDWYGSEYPGGEAALMRELTGSDQTGYSNLTTVTGDSMGLLLTLFGLDLWADDRVWPGRLTSWDLYPIMALYTSVWGDLQPYTSSAPEPTGSHSVRGGSTAYLEWSPPSSHAPTSIRIRTPSGDELPDVIGMWIFRIQ
jgi:hypothetical protein